jgi:hypothetical protein
MIKNAITKYGQEAVNGAIEIILKDVIRLGMSFEKITIVEDT